MNMKPGNFHLLILVLLGLGPLVSTGGFLGAQPTLQLDTVQERKGHPVIDINMSSAVQDQVLSIRGKKLVIKDATLNLDGKRVTAEEIKLRGQSSLNYRRKSFTVDLEEETPLPFDHGPFSLKKFYLVSMNMDQHYFHNKLAYACLDKLDLFGLREGYVEVRLNNQTEGIYLMLQRPEDHLMDDLQARYYLRRGYKDSIDEDEADKSLSRELVKACRQRFNEIFQGNHGLRGEDLYRYLSERLDLQAYMRWMAFNYLVRNGDYSDEVYFYILDPQESLRFKLIGWDYDDIFASQPHEGQSARSQWLDDQLIFSAEGGLDRRIGSDEYLYRRYLQELEYVLETLDPEWLAQTCTGIFAQLSSFYRKNAIIRMAEYDRGKFTSKETLARALEQTYTVDLLQRRAETLKQLEAMGI